MNAWHKKSSLKRMNGIIYDKKVTAEHLISEVDPIRPVEVIF